MNKHFLLGAGLALTVTFAASSAFALPFVPNAQNQLMPCLALGGKTVTVAECNAVDAGTGSTSSLPAPSPQLPPCKAGQSPAPGAGCIPSDSSSLTQQPSQPTSQPASQSSQQVTTPTQSDPGISELKKILEEMKAEDKSKKEQADKQEQDDILNEMKKILQQSQQPDEEIPANKKVDKSKLSSVKNPAVTLAKKGLKNADKLLNTLSKKFNKEKTKTKRLAVVRSVAKDFMKLCTKYASDTSDEEFDDEESFTCDEFVADLSEPIAAALKSKDAELAFELTYDALTVNFKELFNSLIQQ